MLKTIELKKRYNNKDTNDYKRQFHSKKIFTKLGVRFAKEITFYSNN